LTTLLRLATAGSVDDGKSTLIGRLLHDSKAILADQYADLNGRDGELDLSRLTDGLKAEREQGITIDVAYRYFATPARDFILADTPGHVQYTRNMVTGASTADVAIVLVDARHGVVEQTKRHAFIAALLGIPHLVVAVNKMDLVGFSEERFDEIVRDFCAFRRSLASPDVAFIPISALNGDNVVDRSEAMPWYGGTALLEHLEAIDPADDRNLTDLRFPVQLVIRSEGNDYRGYAGQVASGVVRPGDRVRVLPSGVESTVEAVETLDGPLEEAYPPLSVTVRLEDDVDVSRGDMICRANNHPTPTREFEAMVCWLSERPLQPAARYRIKHTTRTALAKVDQLRYRMDVNTLHRDEEATSLGLNEIGRLRLRLSAPLLVDEFRRNRATGSFILIDESTNDTVGAGMILDTDGALA
jgi:bifunctional enzyme CysN/CysC